MTIKLLGWAGSAVVIVAYWPQIHHLYVEKCAWGLSITTWMLWLVSSLLLLTYAIMLGDALFICVQLINIAAIVTTIILAERDNTVCPFHLAEVAARPAQTAGHLITVDELQTRESGRRS